MSTPGPELRTDRLLMRRWLDSDRAPFAAMNADPEVMRYFPAPLTRAASDAMIDRIEAQFDDHGWGLWALEVRQSAAFIGFTGLGPMPVGMAGEGGVEVGWRFAAAAWGQGYATEAALAARDFGFDVAGLDELWSLTALANEPSIAMMHRLGMTHVATQDHPRVPEGPLRRHVIYHLTRPSH